MENIVEALNRLAAPFKLLVKMGGSDNDLVITNAEDVEDYVIVHRQLVEQRSPYAAMVLTYIASRFLFEGTSGVRGTDIVHDIGVVCKEVAHCVLPPGEAAGLDAFAKKSAEEAAKPSSEGAPSLGL